MFNVFYCTFIVQFQICETPIVENDMKSGMLQGAFIKVLRLVKSKFFISFFLKLHMTYWSKFKSWSIQTPSSFNLPSIALAYALQLVIISLVVFFELQSPTKIVAQTHFPQFQC